MMPLDSNRSVPPCQETFTVQPDFLGSDCFGQQVLCETNTLLLDWNVAAGFENDGGRKRDVVELAVFMGI
jgi:hypothetical protein